MRGEDSRRRRCFKVRCLTSFPSFLARRAEHRADVPRSATTAFETLRVYRPRMLICGDRGMGQAIVGAAVLHHLEGFHVQNLDLATLVSDSSRTLEAACVQLFIEAKRHKPSILFIPQLLSWCASVGETVRATITGLLDGLDPSDPILLLAVVEGEFRELPADVRRWFGFVKGNRVVLGKPGPVRLASSFSFPPLHPQLTFPLLSPVLIGSTFRLFPGRPRRYPSSAKRVPRRYASSQAHPREARHRSAATAASTDCRRDREAGAGRPETVGVPQVEAWAGVGRAEEEV